MSSTALNRPDRVIRAGVENELEWAPDVTSERIGVAVNDGAASLSGEVDSYEERPTAVRAVLRVDGVTTVVDNIVAHPASSPSVTDTDIAKHVEHTLERAANVPDSVEATIEDHDVVLSGTVDWDFQRRAAHKPVQNIRSVYIVRNNLTLSARASAHVSEVFNHMLVSSL